MWDSIKAEMESSGKPLPTKIPPKEAAK